MIYPADGSWLSMIIEAQDLLCYNREGAKHSGGKIAGLVPATGEHR